MKRVLVFFLFSCFLSFHLLAFNLPEVADAKITKRSSSANDHTQSVIYQVRSDSTRQFLISQYKQVLLAQGWILSPKSSRQRGYYYFENPPLETVSIDFKEYEKNKTFHIVFSRIKTVPTLPQKNFKSPREIRFMPVFPGAREYGLFSHPSGKKSAVYLAGGPLEKVQEYYLRKASSYGWTLVRTESHDGVYPLTRWLKIVDPFTHQTPSLKARGMEKLVPPLRVRGKTFTFHNGIQRCVITVYRFEDIVEKAVGTIFDVDSFAVYGRNLICVFFSPTGDTISPRTGDPDEDEPSRYPLPSSDPSGSGTGTYKIPKNRYYKVQ